MFTGLVECLGQIERVEPKGPDAILWIKPAWPLEEAVLGESVAVNGACLTVTNTGTVAFSADVSAESLSRTNLGTLKSGSQVNLERALKLTDRLGGHLVSGHVDCLGQVREVRQVGGSLHISISLPAAHMRYVAPKGSVTINGVSLTVNEVMGDVFNVNIIPHTARQTTLHLVKTGHSVNIETDLLAKYIEKLLQPGEQTRGLTFEDLARMGY